MNWRELVLRVMRVPPTPQPPPGSPPRVFRAAHNFFYLRLLRWMWLQVLAVAGALAAIYWLHGMAGPKMPRVMMLIWTGAEIVGIAVLALEILFGWMVVRLDFELRWYMLSDRALRVREGITTVREKTVALANIQNIAVRQGPLQRLLGIADVEVKTAGGGGSSSGMEHDRKGKSEPMHVAYFRGVDNAEEIRDLLREAVRRHRDAGLGDPDEPQRSGDDDVAAAAAELLSAARALRAAASASSPS
jgi:uncharacterized membrane protein YdbT with pleckstrin-like domain